MVCYNYRDDKTKELKLSQRYKKKGWAKEMPTGRESVLNELREQELKRAKKIVEVNLKILKAAREEYRLLLEECNDPKMEAIYVSSY